MKTVWTENFILALVESQEGAITPKMRDSVSSAVKALSEDPVPQRTLLRFMHHCPSQQVTSVLSRFVFDPPRFSIFDTVSLPKKPRDEA